MTEKRRGRASGARARGLRTLQHQTLAPAVRRAIDTEVWMRSLLPEQPEPGATSAGWATKEQVHDEALAWFLDTHAREPPEDYPARRSGDEDLTFWLDSRLMQRARRMAVRDGVRVARLIDAALSGYVRQHVPAEWLEFRARVITEATQLHARHRGGARPAGTLPRRAPRRASRRG